MKKILLGGMILLSLVGCSKEEVIESSNVHEQFETMLFHFNMESFTVVLDSVIEIKTQNKNGLQTVTRLKKPGYTVSYSKKDKMLIGIDNKNRIDLIIKDAYSITSNTSFGVGSSLMLALNQSGFYCIGRTGTVFGQEGTFSTDTNYYFKNKK